MRLKLDKDRNTIDKVSSIIKPISRRSNIIKNITQIADTKNLLQKSKYAFSIRMETYFIKQFEWMHERSKFYKIDRKLFRTKGKTIYSMRRRIRNERQQKNRHS